MIPSAPALSAALALLVKATLVVAAAGLVTAALGRRASAATRHLVWLLAVVALLALPLLGAVLPAWRVASVAMPAAVAKAVAPASPTVASSVDGIAADPVADAPRTITIGSPPTEAASAPDAARIGLWGWMAMVYAAGMALVLMQIALGRGEVRRLSRDAVPLHDDPAWGPLLRDLVWIAGLDRPVALLRSRRLTMPMTWGTRRPTILLPHDADGWPEERKRVVLLHELAHVARYDCLSQMVAGVACALYWVHPGVWYAARRLRVERELACDDRVLAAGTRARAYAEHLLDVARTLRPASRTAMVAVSMARPSHLEGRMLAVLDGMRRRGAPSGRRAGIAAAACALLLVPVAAATVGAALAPIAGVLPAVGAVHASRRPQEQVIERTVAARPGGKLTIDLQTGAVLEIVGWGRDQVFLNAELGGRDWRDTRVELVAEGDGARLRSRDVGGREHESTHHHFTLRVPRSFDVMVASAGGAITLRGLQGEFTGETGGGKLLLERVSGRAELSTGGGEIDVIDARLDGAVRTGGGNVRLANVQGGLRGSTGAGEVLRSDGRGEDGRDGPITIRRAGGAINVDDAPYGADLSTGGGSVRVQRARRFVNAHTGAGAVTLRSVDGDVKVSTGNGAVDVTLTGIPEGTRRVEVHSGLGNVTVRVPIGVGVDLDLETGSTRSHDEVNIFSDYAVPVTRSPDYEAADGGTPRKFVRSRARIGDGRLRVVVRTVNGHVFLRREGESRAPDSRGMMPYGGMGLGIPERSPADVRAAGSLERTAVAASDARTQREATQSLADLPDDVGLDGLVRIALQHPGTEARIAAAAGLGRMACDESIDALRRMVDRERDGAVRRRAIAALGSTVWRTDVDRHASPAEVRAILQRMAQSHPDDSVRREARKELAAVDRRRT